MEAYVAQRIARIPAHISLGEWKRAWEEVIAASPILRTRLVRLESEPGLQQVVLKENITWQSSLRLSQYLEADLNDRMELGQNLARYAIVEEGDERHMVWTVHHVLYDGWSEPVILHQITNALNRQQPTETPAQMRDFVRFVHDTDYSAMQDFWRQELRGAVGPYFPRLPTRDFVANPTSTAERQISFRMKTGSSFTLATFIRAAWALVASQYTGNDDVVFGETMTGRDVALSGVEDIVGPLIATIPMRIRIQRARSVESYLQAVQQGVLSRTPYQHMGWQNIRKVSNDAQYASEAGTGLVIQPEPEWSVVDQLGFQQGDVVKEALHFNPYPLMLACGIRKDGFRVCASFDSSLIEPVQMGRILAQLEVVCLRLATGLSSSMTIREISCLPEQELNRIWSWNRVPPLTFDDSFKSLRASDKVEQGSAYPPAVVSWVCDSRNPLLLAPIGSVGELWLESSLLPGSIADPPAWLLTGSSICAGRSSHVQRTGDLVILRDDGKMTFVGRKNPLLETQGNAVDAIALESLLSQHLSPAIYSVTKIPSNASEKELVVLIEQRTSEDFVELMSRAQVVSYNNTQTTICSTISASLALKLKKIDKLIRNSLPSYMVPSSYVMVDVIPRCNATIKPNSCEHTASRTYTTSGGPRQSLGDWSCQSATHNSGISSSLNMG